MPVIASCPGCGGPLSETSVVALAPVCDHCRGVVVELGGTMGVISAYGVNDPTIGREMLEAHLAVVQRHLANYNGMKESCKEQLTLGLEPYAKLPNPPELLPLQTVPDLWGKGGPGLFLGLTLFWWVLICVPGGIIAWIISLFSVFAGNIANIVALAIGLAITAQMVHETVSPHYKAIAANGERPAENARRQKTYDDARVAALKAAEPKKAAQDHRLKSQIIEIEGLEKTVRKIEGEVELQLLKL